MRFGKRRPAEARITLTARSERAWRKMVRSEEM